MRFVVEHLPDPGRVFGEIARVLSPGGHLAILTPNAWNPVTWIIRGVPNRYHAGLNRRLFGRNGRDTYPVQYRANSLTKLGRMLRSEGFAREAVALNGDPTYLSFGPVSYAMARGLERVLAAKPMRGARVHIIAIYRKR
jgi:SAM-dependent methyltransferase